MNKDIIYIEPEDDITDIVTKIENSQSKIVAIVPPKKADILHSSINIKLINKAGKNAEKKVVLVTTDTTIIKHAAAVKLPITKDLQTAPVIPTLKITNNTTDDAAEDESSDEEFDELKNKRKKAAEVEEEISEDDETTAIEEEIVAEAKAEEKENRIELTAEDVKEEKKEKGGKANKKEAKAKKKAEKEAKKAEKTDKGSKNKVFAWFKKYRKWFFIGTPIAAVVTVALIWAFVIAPAVDIKIKVRTDIKNFSENITFTTKLEEEDIAAGRFYLEEKRVETPNSVKFEATGKKNVGEKASGSVIVYQYFKQAGTIAINAGSPFTYKSNGLVFYSTTDATISWNGSDTSVCGNVNDALTLISSGCLIWARIDVQAAAAGSDYNVAQATESGWVTAANVAAYSDAAMTGGTDRTITVVQESDLSTAKANLTAGKETENRNALMDGIGEDKLKIDSSFRQVTAEVTSTPALGEEVKEGVEPTATTTTTASIFVVDLTKIREYINQKAQVPEKDYIYAIGNPFIESFTSTETGYAGRLKTNYTVGPNISEQSVLEKIKGVRIGNIKPILADEGASEVEITRSYPWVNSVPGDENKITITIKEE